MKTLYERLSEENRLKIKEASEKWPTSMAILKQSLQLNYAWSEIKMTDAMSLHDAIEPEKAFDLNRFIAFFDEK